MDYGNFEDHVHAIILERGKAYHENGAVTSVEQTGEGWKVTVRGQSDYKVVLNGVERLEEWFCECPHAHGPVCKHVAAGLYELRSRKQAEIEITLDQVSTADLRDFVKFHATMDPAIHEALALFVAGRRKSDEEE